MDAVFQGQVGTADAADAGAGLGKFFWMPRALWGAVVAGRDDLTVADDDAADLTAQAGGPERRGKREDHGVGVFVGTLLITGEALYVIVVRGGSSGATGTRPGRPRG